MTFVIRITLSLLAVVTLITLSADADAQILRRLRDNIRSSFPPQGPIAPPPQLQRPGQLVRPQQGPVAPQLQLQRPGQVARPQQAPVAPQLQLQRPVQVVRPQQGQYGQSLTPYSRLTPEQRNASATVQLTGNITPANPNVNSGSVNVRVVTYYDPRTGRNFQRRFIVPPNNNTVDQPVRMQIAGGDSPKAVPTEPQRRLYDKIPKPAVVYSPRQLNVRPAISVVQQQPTFSIPPLSVNQPQARIQQIPATVQQLPTLAGPSIMAVRPSTASQEYVTPAIQSPNLQLAPTPSITIANAPINVGNEIQIDTAVAPATATSDTNNTAINIGSAATDDGDSVAYSVLEMSDNNANVEPANAEPAIAEPAIAEPAFPEIASPEPTIAEPAFPEPAITTEPVSQESAGFDIDIKIEGADDVEKFFGE